MMLLDEIKEALTGVNGPVFYGTAAALPKTEPWNYAVFSRADIDVSAHLTSAGDAFEVALVHEGYLPQDAIDDAVKRMSGIPGMSLAQGSSIRFVYSVKPGTKTTVEMAVLTFGRARKAVRGARR